MGRVREKGGVGDVKGKGGKRGGKRGGGNGRG